MPAARGVKRTASKAPSTAPTAGPKNKKKRGVTQLSIPSAPKQKGRVVSCGQGDVGQLGLGEDIMETTRFKFVSAMGDDIVDICAGGMHSVALDVHGKVWTFGCNDEGALGRPTSSDTDEGTPSIVQLPSSAVRITAGDSHTAALLDNGKVFAWGAFRDSHGSMGLVMSERVGKSCQAPTHITVGETAADIASGGDHLVILTTSGSIFTMGCGEQGQLGRLAQRSASREARQGFSALLVPSKVTVRGGAKKVWAGYHATFAVNNDDKLLAWGLNNYGQLGISGDKRKIALYAPTPCDSAPATSWSQVSCGQHHTLFTDNDGHCYTAGRCEYGRLGLGEGHDGDAETVIAIPKLEGKKCISIAAGTSSSYAVTSAGELFSWGMGSEGQLGCGSCDDRSIPLPCAGGVLDDHTPIGVSAGGQHTLCLLRSNAQPESTSKASQKETAEQKTTAKEKEKEKRPAKRQKVTDPEVSSSSTADVNDIKENNLPEPTRKVNGSESDNAPMEVDDAEKSEEDDLKIESTPETDTIVAEQKPSEAAAEAQDAGATVEAPSEEAPEPADDSKQTDAQTDKVQVDVEMKTADEVNANSRSATDPETAVSSA